VDLAATNPEKYSFLSFPLFSVVGLIDTTRAAGKVDHRVTERWRYPYLPQKNKVVFSTTAPRIQTQVAQVINSVTNVNSTWSQQQAAWMNTLTNVLLGAKGGSVRLLDTDGDGEPDTLYIADSPDPETAEKVWRFNYEGWGASQNGYTGPYVLGATFQDGGTINATNLRVTNINGENILDKTIGNAPIADSAIVERTLDTGAVTTNKIGGSAVTTAKIKAGAVTGGGGGSIAGSTITTANTSGGINTSLGNADFSSGCFKNTNTPTWTWVTVANQNFYARTLNYKDHNGNNQSISILGND
jgi:hypothetical protein